MRVAAAVNRLLASPQPVVRREHNSPPPPSPAPTRSLCTNGGTNTVTVEFTHQTGNLPLITGDATYLSGGGATVTSGDVRQGTTEDIECSGQGNCDRLLGTCSCFDQYVSSDGSGDGITGGMKGDCGALNVFSSYEHNAV